MKELDKNELKKVDGGWYPTPYRMWLRFKQGFIDGWNENKR